MVIWNYLFWNEAQKLYCHFRHPTPRDLIQRNSSASFCNAFRWKHIKQNDLEKSKYISWKAMATLSYIKQTTTQTMVFLCTLKTESTKRILKALTKLRFRCYTCHPDIIANNQGPQFVSVEWRNLLRRNRINFQSSSIKSVNVIGSNEKYHLLLWNVFNQVESEIPNLSK